MMSAILRLRSLVVPLAILAVTAGCSPSTAINPPLTFLQNVQLPTDTTKPSLDLLTLDDRNSRLYVSHSSSNSLDIVDVKGATFLGSVPGLKAIKGTALTSDPNIVFTSNSGDGSVSVVDVAARKVTDNIKVGITTDAIDYDRPADLIVVALSSDHRVALIDRSTKKVLGGVPIPGKPELFAIDQLTGKIYLAINDKDQVVGIDPAAKSITETYSGCDIHSPTGLIFDPDQGRLFVVNSIVHSANVVSVIDVLIGKCLGSIDIDHSPDQAAFNQRLHHMYIANAGSNNISIIDTVSMKPLGIIGSGKQAATIAADPNTGRVCIGVARAGLIGIYHDP
jgi:YVTN family beta-propeller protein